MKFRAAARAAILAGCALVMAGAGFGQQYSPDLYSGMRWRLVGPYRAGRVTTVAGISGRPEIYYMGTPGGGVWKTVDGGRVWQPIFDDAHVASIGALAVAPSNPNVIYVGTGEQTDGNGVYKSTDAGATWTNIGLKDTKYIVSVIADPKDANTVLVGAFGNFNGGQARGVFKTTDGGATWTKTLFRDEKTGITDMCADPSNPQNVYAATITFDFSQGPPKGPSAFIYKSTDEGSTWKETGGAGLPEQFRGRIGVAAAPGNSGRVYAVMNQGFYRSDDGGATWTKSTNDPRVVGSFYFSRIFVDPQNADVVYVVQTSMYRSTDGGKTFDAYKGAPSGEDQHVLWIAPENSKRMILGSDQGAIISVDGGVTWNSWFNQPTGQLYHVITDNQFPYYSYASQQDSGTVAVPNRSDFGEISYRDWFSTGGFESGYNAPDPLHPNWIYTIGWFGTVLRMDRVTGQVSTVFVPGPKYRYTWETPLVFSRRDPKTLYEGTQFVVKSSDDAVTWTDISPDLTEKPAPPPPPGKEGEKKDEKPAEPIRGVIQTVAPSPVEAGTIWVGTSTGLIQVTRDSGTSWQKVTPAGMPDSMNIFLVEASPADAATAYFAGAARDDSHPYFYRTRDGGKTWQKITTGLPESGIARVVREDPARKGLLFAGTETGAYVSFDDGDNWQSLQLNLPTTSVRDLQVHGDDLVGVTFGRGMWILDDLTPLRELDGKIAKAKTYLFKPQTAMRVRWDNNQDTPLPADTPTGENPANGAIIDYYLSASPTKEITLDIRDTRGNVVHHYSSTPPPNDPTTGNAPTYWFAPPDVLSTKAGMNRFVWNLEYDHPQTLTYSYYGNHLDYMEYTLMTDAIPGKTPRYQPEGAYAVPGKYEVVLSVDGKAYRQPLEVTLDPRVHVSQADLQAQLDLSLQVTDWIAASYTTYNQMTALASVLGDRVKSLTGNAAAKDAQDSAAALEKELSAIQDGTSEEPGAGVVNRDLARYIIMVQVGDLRPANSAREESNSSCTALKKDLARWRTANSDTVPALNKLLEKYNLSALPTVVAVADPKCGS
ncbi:MAG: WD40/YVTN/BNR-like repeat-containing protein [Candidatus Acidiferrales bacterium]